MFLKKWVVGSSEEEYFIYTDLQKLTVSVTSIISMLFKYNLFLYYQYNLFSKEEIHESTLPQNSCMTKYTGLLWDIL